VKLAPKQNPKQQIQNNKDYKRFLDIDSSDGGASYFSKGS
jgi:hypothetical protein